MDSLPSLVQNKFIVDLFLTWILHLITFVFVFVFEFNYSTTFNLGLLYFGLFIFIPFT